MKRVSMLTFFKAVLFIALLAILYTCALDPDLDNKKTPLMELQEATDITRSGGTFTCVLSSSYGIIEKGFIYGADPSLSDAKSLVCKDAFLVEVSGLNPGTNYFFLSYIKGKNSTVRSEVKSFQTVEGTVPVVVSSAVTEITYQSAKCGGLINDDGGYAITAKGVCWSTSQNPTISDRKTSDGSGSGSFRSSITNLNPGVTYYVRAYATNQKGTSYGEQDEFITPKTYAPTVTTATPSSITYTSVVSGGNVTNAGTSGVTARGVCWGTSKNPTISGAKTNDGSGQGSYSSSITGLSAGTKYYVRAYATNGFGTSYGDEKSFSTLDYVSPEITTLEPSEIGTDFARSGGTITSDGGSAITVRGICWSTSRNPITSDDSWPDGSGIGSYHISMSGLHPKTTYYVRAYATNSVGTYYGDEKSFTTLNDSTSPILNTATPTSVTENSAISGGTVISDGGEDVTARGVCWGTSENPTISGKKTIDGVGIGQFSSSITDLSAETKYYVRAYATNSIGTAYGGNYSFTTEAEKNYSDLSADGTSNCYIVETPGRYSFTATVIGNGDAGLLSYPQATTGFHTTTTIISPRSAGIVWDEPSGVISNVSFSDGTVKFDASAQKGNALVAVYSDENCKGDILWSWHIWLTDKSEDVVYTNRADKTFTVMAENLGATAATGVSSYGLFYQWGRKDPFENIGIVSSVNTNSTNGTILYTISHPQIFISSLESSQNSCDWLYPSRNNYLWGNPEGYLETYTAKKTIYDPCPPGYMVAPADIWTRFTLDGGYSNSQSGFNVYGGFSIGWNFFISSDKSGDTDFYGAAGWRGYSDGSLYNVNTHGHYWSSSPSDDGKDSGASFLNFNSGMIYPKSGIYRALGQSIRCVRE